MERIRKEMLMEALQMAWPAVLESFFVALAGMIDTMMVATMGSYAVASVGLTQQPKFISLTLFFAINVAVSAIVARRKGEQKRRAANEMLVTALAVCTGLCIVITGLFLLWTPALMRFAGSNADTHDSAVAYFRIITGGSFFNIITMVINSAQRGSGNTRISMKTNLVSSCVNILFNYLLIGGHFGFPALGVTGAAIATVLGTVVAFLMSVHSMFLKNSYVSIPLILREKITPTRDSLKNIVRLGTNMCVENLVMRVGFLATALLAARLGTDEFAAHNVGMNLLSLTFSFADGMQAAAVALSGQALGAGEKERAKQYGTICQHIGLGISVCLSLLLLIGGRWFFGLYFAETHIIDMGVIICRFMCVIVLLQISQIIFGACLRAAGDIFYTLMASLISVAVIRTVVTWVLVSVFQLGLVGVWLGILSDQMTRFLLMGFRFRQGKWVEIRL